MKYSDISPYKLLIIYPHWHPANLAGVHRPRLTGNFLPEVGWKVHVLTVDKLYYEETPDPEFHKTFSSEFQVCRVKAKPLRKPRFIGDIGLRSMPFIKEKAVEIIQSEDIDFIWIPIPSFYTSLIGPWLHKRTGVPYGIDYIDPWVRDLTNQKNLRAILSQGIARLLEPRAIKRAALISGVSEEYYLPALRRNFGKSIPAHVAFPYGFDPNDHKIILKDLALPWADTGSGAPSGKRIWLYTGAFLPNSHLFVDMLFNAISELRVSGILDDNNRWCFLGTGPYPAKRITAYAEDHGISDLVLEVRDRFPYLQTLNFQSAADTVMIIGSTEKHYTASKTYQSLLSGRPVFSVLHGQSQAVQVLEECNAHRFLIRYEEGMKKESLIEKFKQQIIGRLQSDDWHPELEALNKYSALESARKLSTAIESIL